MVRKLYKVVIITILLFITGCSQKDTNESMDISSDKLNETKSLSFFGNMVSLENRDIKVEYLIEVDEIFVKNGDYVERGEPLIRYTVDNIHCSISELEKDVQVEEIKLQILNDRLDRMEKEKTNLEKQLQEFENNENYLKQLEITMKEKEICKSKYDNAISEYNSIKKLQDKDETKKAQLEEAKIKMYELEVACAGLEIKEDQMKYENTQKINEINLQIDNLKENVKQTETFEITIQNLEISEISDKLDKLHAVLSSVEDDNYIVSAPCNCVISSVTSIEKVEYNKGTTLMKISNTDSKVICIKALEDFAHYFSIGGRISVIFDETVEGRKTGVISDISNMVFSSSSGNIIEVYVVVEDLPKDIRIGTTVELELILMEGNNE